MSKNPPGKETSKRVGSAAGRLRNKRRNGLRFFAVEFKSGLQGYSLEMNEVTDDVVACAGSAHVQRQIPKRARRRKGRGKK